MVLTTASMSPPPAARVHVVTSAISAEYQEFLVHWALSVDGLVEKPDTVTIALGEHGRSTDLVVRQVTHFLPGARIIRVEDTSRWEAHPPTFVNHAILSTPMDGRDWVAKLDADDRAHYDWLTGIRDEPADVWMCGLTWVEQHPNTPFQLRHPEMDMPPRRFVTAEAVLDAAREGRNLIWSCSPFRRWLWDANPFQAKPGEDWQFWVDAAKRGATFTAAEGAYYFYHRHPGQLSEKSTDAQMRAGLTL